MGTGTIRQQIIDMLLTEQLGARELSQALHIREKEVYEHFSSISKTLSASGKKLVVDPPVCLNCGFIFRDRKRFHPPGHCPKCKKTHIHRPLFSIK